MAGPIDTDGVRMWTRTSGLTRPYVIGGTVAGNMNLTDLVSNGDWFYVLVYSGPRWERIKGQYDSPDEISTLEIVASSNSNNAVSWPTSNLRLIRGLSPLRGKLAALAATTGAANKLPYLTGSESIGLIDFQAQARRLLSGYEYIYEAPTTGATITLAADVRRLVIDPAGTIATLTVTLPPSPQDGDVLELRSSQQVTAITVNGAAGETVIGGTGTLAANSRMSWLYRVTGTTWFGGH